MVLTLIDNLNGVFSLGVLCFTIVFALRFFLRYWNYKRIEFLLLGFCIILIAEPWWPHSVAFIYAITTGSETGLVPEVYFIIGNVFIPLAIFFWLWVFSELTIKQKQKQILQFGGIYLIFYEVIFFSMLLIDPLLIGELQGPIHVKYNMGMIGLLLSGVVIAAITGFRFIQFSLRSDNPEIVFRGKLLLLSVMILFAGAIMEAFLSTDVSFLTISRILLIICGIGFYIAFVPPEIIKRRFINKQ